MNSNSFGILPRITVFGQSHDPEIGVLIDGLPRGLKLDMELIESLLERRRPGQSNLTTPRSETDTPQIETGIKDGVTTGRQMRVTFKNSDTRGKDYDRFRVTPRPSHADYLAVRKYGAEHDIAGGGRFSGRLTLPITFAGALCLQILREQGIEIHAKLIEVEGAREGFEKRIIRASHEGDSVGGVVELVATGLKSGIGEHPYSGVEPTLSQILFAIPGVRGVEFGAGFKAAQMRGSAHNDPWIADGEGSLKTVTNNAGGVVAGMTTGMDLIVRVAFKPTPSIACGQLTANIETGKQEVLAITGRHDPCIAVRGVPVVEAACAIGLLNLINLDSTEGATELEGLRGQINTLDDEIARLYEKRILVAQKIAHHKKTHDIVGYDPGREQEILDRLTSGKAGEVADHITQLYALIFDLSRGKQDA